MSTPPFVKRVAVIGAGISGLPTIKHCLEEQVLKPVCFEMRSQLGGLWRYTDEVVTGWSSVAKNTVTNTYKETFCYSDFPIPDDFPVYLPHEKVLEYLKMYAKKFDLEKYIRFDTEVTDVSQTSDFDQTGRWNVSFRSTKTGTITTETFDAVCVCTGQFSIPSTPEYEGQDMFKGKQLHAQAYRDGREFEGKRVVVLGLGNTAADIACDLSRHCKQVFVSTRCGAWVLPRFAPDGGPIESYLLSVAAESIIPLFPKNLSNYFLAKIAQGRCDHELLGLEPEHEVWSQKLVLNDELPAILLSGKIKLKEGMKRLTEDTVVFEDGSVEENIDAVIYATGYKFTFPFVKHPAFERSNATAHFYKFVFPPDMDRHTIAAIGCVEVAGSNVATSEIHSRWVVKVLKEDVKLPERSEMLRHVSTWRQAEIKTYPPSTHDVHNFSWLNHLNEVGEEIGCRPNISKLFLSDPVLAWHLIFGPIIPSHYRLVGPGAWSGSRQHILTVHKRITAPLRTRRITRGNWRTIGMLVRVTAFVVILSVILAIIF